MPEHLLEHASVAADAEPARRSQMCQPPSGRRSAVSPPRGCTTVYTDRSAPRDPPASRLPCRVTSRSGRASLARTDDRGWRLGRAERCGGLCACPPDGQTTPRLRRALSSRWRPDPAVRTIVLSRSISDGDSTGSNLSGPQRSCAPDHAWLLRTFDLDGEMTQMNLSTSLVDRRRFLLGLAARPLPCSSRAPARHLHRLAVHLRTRRARRCRLAHRRAPDRRTDACAGPVAGGCGVTGRWRLAGRRGIAGRWRLAVGLSGRLPLRKLPRPPWPPKPSGTVKRGGTLKINSQNDWSTMDVQTSQTGNQDSPLVFDFLARHRPQPPDRRL